MGLQEVTDDQQSTGSDRIQPAVLLSGRGNQLDGEAARRSQGDGILVGMSYDISERHAAALMTVD